MSEGKINDGMTYDEKIDTDETIIPIGTEGIEVVESLSRLKN